MKKTSMGAFVVLFSCLCAQALVAASFSVEAGASYANVSGLYSPTWEYVPLKKVKDTFAVPEIGLRCQFAENWAASVGYARYSSIRSEGSTGYRILDPSDQPTGLVYPAKGDENIDEFTAKLLYCYEFSPGLRIEAGPVASVMARRFNYESYEVWATDTMLPMTDREYDKTSLRLGAQVGVRIRLDARWSLSVGYRYAAPSGHDIHLLGVAVGCGL